MYIYSLRPFATMELWECIPQWEMVRRISIVHFITFVFENPVSCKICIYVLSTCTWDQGRSHSPTSSKDNVVIFDWFEPQSNPMMA